MRWLTAALILGVASSAAAEDVAWGRAVEGVQLGLAIAPDSGPLPSELRLIVQARNVTSSPRQLPVAACPQLGWTSFAILNVRVDGGGIFRFQIGSRVDVANLHPHGPVPIGPGEILRERFALLPLIPSQGLGDQDSRLGALLQVPRQLELWVELLDDQGKPRMASGRLKQRFGLSSEGVPPAAGACVKQVVASGGAACALLGDGTPWCWGATPPGVRGEGEDTDVPKPQPLRLLAGAIVELGMWSNVLCARTGKGAVYCAGAQTDPAGEPMVSGQPLRVLGVEGAVGLHVGSGEQCARTADGALSCWGVLGAPAVPSSEGLVSAPWKDSAGGVAQVAIGSGHACALRKDGTLWCWGRNESGQLGTGDTEPRTAPVQLTGLGPEVVSVAAGAAHTCAALRDGSVRCWGRSEYGALGLGQLQSSPAPSPVPGLGEVVRVAAGYQKTCAWKKDGSVWCFGELLRDPPPRALAPAPVELTELGHAVEEVVFGFRHTCARTAAREGVKAGSVLCWGENPDGQLGSGVAGEASGVARVVGLDGKAVALTAGDYFTCALASDGLARCWGSGFSGQLGTGRKDYSSPSPVRVQLPCQGKAAGKAR